MAAPLSFFRSETSQRLRSEGRAEMLVRLLVKRGFKLSVEAREHIMTCADIDTLNAWFDQSFTARTTSDLFEPLTPAAAELSLLRSKTAQQLRDRGYDERYVQGYVESFVEGFFEGTAKSVLTVLDQRGIEVSDTTREHVATCRDIETLTPWLTRVGTADSADEIFLEA